MARPKHTMAPLVLDEVASEADSQASASSSGPSPLRLTAGYLTYSLFHLVLCPYLAARFFSRLAAGRYRGAVLTRLFGGTRPPCRKRWVLIVGTGHGETRTAVNAADEVFRFRSEDVAVLTHLSAPLRKAVAESNSQFPVGHAPFNSPWSALLALYHWRPRAVLFVEFSSNYHLASLARLFGVRTSLINVNLPEKRTRRLHKKPLGFWQFQIISRFAVQGPAHRDRLVSLGIPRKSIVVSGIGLGTFKSDSPEGIVSCRRWRELLGVTDGPVIVAGSTYPQEEIILLEAFDRFKKQHPNAQMILAPRHQTRKEGIIGALEATCTEYVKRSEITKPLAPGEVLLLDSVGELSDVYGIATCAFVGGSLIPGLGGHSPLEVLAWGIPITMGPYFAQQEVSVQACLDGKVLTTCHDADDLVKVWHKAASSPEFCTEVERLSRELIEHASTAFCRAYDISVSD